MNRTIGAFGVLTALLSTAACGSHIRNLGDDAGGAAAVGGFAATGGAVSTGGKGPTATGGAAETGGIGPTATGGAAETGGIGPVPTGGSAAVVPYVVDPTVPIDPSCSCPSVSDVCNAANQCVPRCDDGNRCAKWLANQAVVDIIVDGTTLYFAEQATPDPVGNPGTNGALYSVSLPNGTPTLVAGQLGNPRKIVGRYKNATYIETSRSGSASVIQVTDTGTTSVLDGVGDAPAMWDHWLAYPSADYAELRGIDLDKASLQPIMLHAISSGVSTISSLIVMQDVVIYFLNFTSATTTGSSICSIQLSNPTLDAMCEGATTGHYEVATSGTQYYLGLPFSVISYRLFDTGLLTLYDINAQSDRLAAGKLVYNDGWLYIDFWSMLDANSSRLARVPTSVVRSPQDILPDWMVTRYTSYGLAGGGWTNTSKMVFAVNQTDVYWAQLLPPEAENKPQYIFSAPLPPKPCDADLPCADSTLVCTRGFCVTP